MVRAAAPGGGGREDGRLRAEVLQLLGLGGPALRTGGGGGTAGTRTHTVSSYTAPPAQHLNQLREKLSDVRCNAWSSRYGVSGGR